MKQTFRKKCRTFIAFAAVFAAVTGMSGFQVVQAEENLDISLPVMKEMPGMDILKDQFDRDLNAPAPYANSESNLPESYDLRDYNLSTPVRNQQALNTCWAFGALASVESNYLKLTGTSPDFSEKHLAYFTKHTRPEGLDQAGEGIVNGNAGTALDWGQITNAMSTLAAWQGPVNESDVPYQDDNGGMEPSAPWTVDEQYRTVSKAHLRNGRILSSPANWTTGNYVYDPAAVEQVKEAVYNYGAVAINYYVALPKSPDEMNVVWNQEHGAYYTSGQNSMNHGVAIVGWDDNFSKDNFGTVKPPADGAFLIKNSYGDAASSSLPYDYMNAIPNDEGGKDYGYFWISYYDQSLSVPISYEMDVDADGFDYEHVEQYDYVGISSPLSVNETVTRELLNQLGYTVGNNESVANVFTADDYVTLEAVSAFSSTENSTVKVAVYVGGESGNPDSGTLASQQTVHIDGTGFYTIDLDQPVDLSPGDVYSIVQTITDDLGNNYLPIEIGATPAVTGVEYVVVSNPGESYISNNGQWLDVSAISPVEWNMETLDISPVERTGEIRFTLGNAMIKAYTNDRQPITAEQVIAMIDNLGEITSLSQEQAVAGARAAYNALTAEQQALVTNLNVLEAAEQAITDLKDKQAVENVISMIDNLEEITSLNQEQAVAAARAAYNSLTAEQQARVTNLGVLEAAEQKIQTLKAQAQDQGKDVPGKETVGSANTPSTGDDANNAGIYIVVLLVAAAAGIAAILYLKKREK